MVQQVQLPLIGGDVARSEKPILCLDFDGVLHSYTSGWQGVDKIADPPVPGFANFLTMVVEHFHVVVHSSRSRELDGIIAMKGWLHKSLVEAGLSVQQGLELVSRIGWPKDKPAAFVTLDDRALTFCGDWPPLGALLNFRPWYQRDLDKESR